MTADQENVLDAKTQIAEYYSKKIWLKILAYDSGPKKQSKKLWL